MPDRQVGQQSRTDLLLASVVARAGEPHLFRPSWSDEFLDFLCECNLCYYRMRACTDHAADSHSVVYLFLEVARHWGSRGLPGVTDFGAPLSVVFLFLEAARHRGSRGLLCVTSYIASLTSAGLSYALRWSASFWRWHGIRGRETYLM